MSINTSYKKCTPMLIYSISTIIITVVNIQYEQYIDKISHDWLLNSFLTPVSRMGPSIVPACMRYMD
ncbi:hypothetical protein WN944_006346 [Citrus x changshan-huyou]|uniref:Uncharacterized protein n=1 Tax=Citrus x changshan-huyou TaxID=2935761 RepID=A0AAP0MLN6_9ROSI